MSISCWRLAVKSDIILEGIGEVIAWRSTDTYDSIKREMLFEFLQFLEIAKEFEGIPYKGIPSKIDIESWVTAQFFIKFPNNRQMNDFITSIVEIESDDDEEFEEYEKELEEYEE